MVPVTQSRVGADGTCFRACLASIFELKESQVPDFSDEEFFEDIAAYLKTLGLRYRRVPIDGTKPSGYSTIEGVSPRGGLHACVAYDGKLVHDPHPQDGTGRGLVEPRYYGLLEQTVRIRAKDVDCPHCKGIGKIGTQQCGWCHGKKTDVTKGQATKITNKLLPSKKTTDRADMLQLRRNTKREGGPLLMQVTEKSGAEHTVPTRALVRDSVNLDRYSMREILDTLGIDIKEYMRRDEAQKNALLRTAIERLDNTARAKDGVGASWLALLIAIYALYKAKEKPETYDLARYQPKAHAFDAVKSSKEKTKWQ